MLTTLRNKTALITGASSGIGAATAREMAKLGTKLMLVSRNPEKLEALQKEIVDIGGTALIHAGDVTQYQTLLTAVERAVQAFGQLDFLVNNAGLIDPIARLADSSPEDWCRVVDTNYKGVYFGLRAALSVMLRQGSGTIVNVSSGAATSALEGWSHYCSSKAAALSLTRCAHKEYGERGIHVVGISPGTVATDMQVAIKKSGINPVSQLDPAVHISANIPAKAIAWLCAGHAKEHAGGDFKLKDNGHIEMIENAYQSNMS